MGTAPSDMTFALIEPLTGLRRPTSGLDERVGMSLVKYRQASDVAGCVENPKAGHDVMHMNIAHADRGPVTAVGILLLGSRNTDAIYTRQFSNRRMILRKF